MTDLEMKGKVSAIDMQKRTLTMKDEQGVLHIYQWTEVLDVVMRKWKPGYFLELKYDADKYLIKSAMYWQEGRDVWPKEKGTFKPRNEKPTIYESAFKTCAELVRPDDFPGKVYAERIEGVRIEADKIAKWIVTESGEGK